MRIMRKGETKKGEMGRGMVMGEGDNEEGVIKGGEMGRGMVREMRIVKMEADKRQVARRMAGVRRSIIGDENSEEGSESRKVDRRMASVRRMVMGDEDSEEG